MPSRRERAAVIASLLALVAATLARLWVVHHLHDQGFFAKYLVFADAILSGHVPRARIGDVSPAYLWTTVLFRALGMSMQSIRDLQVIGVSAAALLCAMAAKRLAGWPAAVAAAVLVLGNRAALVIATELEPEVAILLLNAAAILLVVRRRWGAAGVFVGLSAVARPTALATLALVALWIFVGGERRSALRFTAAALLPVGVIVAVNFMLTGNAIIMQPGTQLYEGNNPLATGCAGVLPRIVNDLNDAATEPDYLHVAYRVVAARATGGAVDPRRSNRYWSAKSLAWMRAYPAAALELFGWKALLSVHNYDVYDLATTKRKGDELGRYPALPFGLLAALSIAAFVLRRERRALVAVALFAVATLMALVAFNVSSRQRNALLAPLAVLAGTAVSEVVALARRRDERALLAFGGVVVATTLLGIEGPPMSEDRYNWQQAFDAARFERAAVQARRQGNVPAAAELAAIASMADTPNPPLVSPRLVRQVALLAAERLANPQRRFDAAIALEKAGAWQEADALLVSLERYRPRRENRAVSSVAFYRARAALHLRAPRAEVQALLARADRESGGDPFVLALLSLSGDAAAGRRLDAMYDPFTRDFALAAGCDDLGDRARAAALRGSLARRIPEWSRVRTL